MDFSVICPNDGPVEVGLESISTVIFNGTESVVIVIICPRCGAEIRVAVQLPDMFISAVEFDGEDPVPVDDAVFDLGAISRRSERVPRPTPVEQRRIDGYCEYFRRQLAGATDVDAVLAEIDSRPRKA